VKLPFALQVAPIWTLSSGVPMDILMPDGSSRIPTLGRNAGGREFHTGSELNAYLLRINNAGGINGQLLPYVNNGARFSDSFQSLDMRISREFAINERYHLQAIGEVFNLFNTTNVLGSTTTNYSGFQNVLVRDSNDPTSPGYMHSSGFGMPTSTAGGVFGSGGARAFQLAARLTF
jgi:hypothetical protein